MGRRSTIERLPNELRQHLLKLLADPNATQQQIAEIINDEAGKFVVSKSAVNRYAVRMKEFQEKNRQAREVAQVYISQFGNDTQNQLGKLVNEQVRMLVFEILMALDEVKKNAANPKEIESLAFVTSKIAKAVKDLESSSTISMDREEKMRCATKKAADDVEDTVRKAGLSDETVEAIKAKILGIAK